MSHLDHESLSNKQYVCCPMLCVNQNITQIHARCFRLLLEFTVNFTLKVSGTTATSWPCVSTERFSITSFSSEELSRFCSPNLVYDTPCSVTSKPMLTRVSYSSSCRPFSVSVKLLCLMLCTKQFLIKF